MLFRSSNTVTQTPTRTQTPTNTPSNTASQTPTQTQTPSNTPTNTPTQTQTPTRTPSNTPTQTPTRTQTPTQTPTQTRTPTPTPSCSCVCYNVVNNDPAPQSTTYTDCNGIPGTINLQPSGSPGDTWVGCAQSGSIVNSIFLTITPVGCCVYNTSLGTWDCPPS